MGNIFFFFREKQFLNHLSTHLFKIYQVPILCQTLCKVVYTLICNKHHSQLLRVHNVFRKEIITVQAQKNLKGLDLNYFYMKSEKIKTRYFEGILRRITTLLGGSQLFLNWDTLTFNTQPQCSLEREQACFNLTYKEHMTLPFIAHWPGFSCINLT